MRKEGVLNVLKYRDITILIYLTSPQEQVALLITSFQSFIH